MIFDDNNLGMIILIFIIASIIFEISDIISEGFVIKEINTTNGKLIIRKTLFGEITRLAFNYSNRLYEVPYNDKISKCIQFINEKNLEGKVLIWFLNANQIYGATKLKPILIAPSENLVYFYYKHQYDAYRYPPFEDRNKIKFVASIFLSSNESLVKRTLEDLNISYILLTKDDILRNKSFLYAIFEGKYKLGENLVNRSILLNAPTKSVDFLEEIYNDSYCWLFKVK